MTEKKEDSRTLLISERDYKRFVKAINASPWPNQKLIEAAQRYIKRLEQQENDSAELR